MEEDKLDSVKISCSCGCSILEFKQEDKSWGGGITLSHYVSSFQSEQKGLWNTIVDRSKMIWLILTGKKYSLYDIVLTKKEAQQLIEVIENINFEIIQ